MLFKAKEEKRLWLICWISLPNPECAVRPTRINGFGFRVKYDVLHGVIMAFEGALEFGQVGVIHFYFSAIQSTPHEVPRVVKSNGICWVLAEIYCLFFFHHSDVPYLNDPIRIAWSYFVTQNIERTPVHWVAMPVESLDAQAGSHIPQRDRFVCTCTCNDVGKRLESDRVHWVNMASKGVPTFPNIDIKNFCKVVHRSTSKEVS